MSGLRVSQTTPATRWISYAAGSLPKVFGPGEEPKAIFSNEVQNVTLIDKDSNSVTFSPAAGVPIQVRPSEINSISGASIIALFD